jgi:PAS domain S-box-containing protein/putative nucleotidyltransferase with HDIG domain
MSPAHPDDGRPSKIRDGGQAVLVISTDRRVLWANEAARALLSPRGEPLAGVRCHRLLSGRESPCVKGGGCPLEEALDSGLPAACTLHPGPDRPALHAALRPVPGPQGEVAEFVLTLGGAQLEAGQRGPDAGDELALLFTVSEMDKRGCSIEELGGLLARSLKRGLERRVAAIYLPSRDARHLVVQGSAFAPSLRRALEQAVGGQLPHTVAVPQRSGSALWRAFRSPRPTQIDDAPALAELLREHARSPSLEALLPSIQDLLDVDRIRLIPIRHQGQPVGLALLGGGVELDRSQRDGVQRTLEAVGDILQRKLQRDERRRLQRRTAAILAAVQDGVLGLDREGRVSFANRSALELLGWSHDHLLGRPLEELRLLPEAPPGAPPGEDCPLRAALLDVRALHRVATWMQRRDGGLIRVEASLAPLRSDGEIRGAVLSFADIGHRERVEAELRESLQQLRLTLAGTVQALGRMAEMRDPYTAGHQQRVAQLAGAIAARMGLPAEAVELIRLAALVHDIGKIGIPVELLTKPGRLAAHELELIRTHTTVGHEILCEAHLHQGIADIARQHHERLDGSGYPDGLEGTAIRREARIIAVADTVEAMASHRPYRPSKGIDEALSEIFRQRGRHYDPDAVDACIQLFRVGGFAFTEVSR